MPGPVTDFGQMGGDAGSHTFFATRLGVSASLAGLTGDLGASFRGCAGLEDRASGEAAATFNCD